MRFDSLQIPAFGPFSNFALKFPRTQVDLHLIYGGNEAGKSSLLRAIHHLFFGIPNRTEDHFLHPNAKLLLGAEITNEDETLTFFRKKGNKNTLLDAKQNSLADHVLAPFLGSVNEEFFTQMFGLNSDSLRQGASKLLSGEGDLGTAIFSASLGGSPIDEAIKNLEAQANALCKGAAKKDTTILPALARYKESEKLAKEEMVTSNAWNTLKSQIKKAEQVFAEKDQAHRDHRFRCQFVESCLQAFPVLASLQELERELAVLKAPQVASDFIPRVRALQKDISQNQHERELRKKHLQEAEKDRHKIPSFDEILKHSEDFEVLHRGNEQYLKQNADLARLEIAPHQSPISRSDELALTELADQLLTLRTQETKLQEELARVELEISTQKQELSSQVSGNPSLLEELHARADSCATEMKLHQAREQDLKELTRKQESLLSRLTLRGESFSGLHIPGEEAIRASADEEAHLRSEISKLQQELRSLRDDITAEENHLKHLTQQAEIVTPQMLQEARHERDSLWSEIQKNHTPTPKLTEAIQKADRIADTLHAEAEILTKASTHSATLAQLGAKKENREQDLSVTEDQLAHWSKNWESRFSGLPISPLAPLDFLEWRRQWILLCDLSEELERLQQEEARFQKEESDLITQLQKALDSQKGDFVQLHRALKTKLKKATQEQGQQSAIQKALTKATLQQEQLQQEAKTLQNEAEKTARDWKSICEKLDLPDAQSPEFTLNFVADRRLAAELQSQVQDYETRLNGLATRCEIEPVESELWALFNEAKRNESAWKTLTGRIESLQQDLPDLELKSENENAQFNALTKGIQGDLEEVIVEIEMRQKLTAQQEHKKETLRTLSGRMSLEDFLIELEKQDAEKLREEEQSLSEKGEALQRERDEAKSLRDEFLNQEAEYLQASDLAAAHQQAAHSALATVLSDTERFMKLHYAIDFLKQQVEDYRQKTQGPMIEKTSHFFQTLTSGHFQKVAAQLDEKGAPQILAIRANGERVRPTGLSEGTADQLYLSLRLSAIDLHLENHPAIPLILDDLLMTFDDERCRALFPVLEEMSRKTQILIFTHHSHLKELAEKTTDSLHYHELKQA